MKLSILILTHNRPNLFKRCIKSVLDNLPDFDIEIHINNDSNDITEIYHDKVKIFYYYKKHKKLTDTYKFLFDSSNGDFVFYLEDDDYIRSNFFNLINFNYDINFLNYIPKDILTNKTDLNEYYQRFFKKFKELYKITDFSDFLKKYDHKDFQLSQMVFKRTGIKYWPRDDSIDNDYKLLCSLDLKSIFYVSKPTWVQTTDGKNNISFDIYNKDKRFI